jgi:hypothetical protein
VPTFWSSSIATDSSIPNGGRITAIAASLSRTLIIDSLELQSSVAARDSEDAIANAITANGKETERGGLREQTAKSPQLWLAKPGAADLNPKPINPCCKEKETVFS